MKTRTKSIFAALALAASLNQGLAQGTAFTYQGRLNDTNVAGPVTGAYDFRFDLFAMSSGGNLSFETVNSAVSVTNGLFTTPVDFGPFPWTGQRWFLEIAVRPGGSVGPFTVIQGRQEVTPTPYAIFAETAATSHSADTLGGTTSAGFWSVTGNNGTLPGVNFLGTTDNQPLILKVNGQEAQRFEPTTDTPNVVGGWSGNSVAAGLGGATIGGGGSVLLFNGQSQPNVVNNSGYYGTISGGYNNKVGGYGGVISGGSVNAASGDFSVVAAGQFNNAAGAFGSIGGGSGNTNSGDYSTVCGGYGNTSGGAYGAIGGGYQNTTAGNEATVAGGYENTSSAFGATVAGGGLNSASGQYATVAGGNANSAEGLTSFAAGYRAKSHNKGTFVWADSQNADFNSTRDNQVAFRCQSGVFFDNGAGLFVNWTPGAGDWAFASDRNLKDRVSAVDSAAILDKVARLTLAEWSYKGYSQRHIGPMAQDFHALFPLNDDDKRLIGADLHGVALAAIQGLNQKVEDQRAALAAEQAQIDQLRLRLDQLEQRILDSKR